MIQVNSVFNVKPDERVTIVGATGSGKSWAAMQLQRSLKLPIPFVNFDSKHSNTVSRFSDRIITTPEDLDRVGKWPNKEFERVCYRTPWDASEDEISDTANNICRWCYQRTHIGFYGDEFTEIAPGITAPRYVRGVAVRGRERTVPLWAASQRPVGIPKVLISESDHYFVFQLRDRADRDRIAQACEHPIQQRIQALAPFEFIYINAKKGTVSPGTYVFQAR